MEDGAVGEAGACVLCECCAEPAGWPIHTLTGRKKKRNPILVCTMNSFSGMLLIYHTNKVEHAAVHASIHTATRSVVWAAGFLTRCNL